MDNRKDLTRRLIAGSFRELMLRCPFEKISILMITGEAGIRRPTFYNHFQDKYDLLEWIVDNDVVAPAEAPLRAGDSREALRVLFTRLTEDAAFYRKAFAVTGQNGFEEAFTARMRDMLLRARGDGAAPERDELVSERIVAGFNAVCFVSVVKNWLDAGVESSVEELIDAYLYLVTHSVWGPTS
ncbi:MAG: TetR/AcrR family transcriptional regulator C-terminal domain-containing protein [Oscillospiraceae bacterium]|nr:TetR/AcrR family transcriptional regulator C-terminal domain-containing protein [Oscillospiraceae bacterium]